MLPIYLFDNLIFVGGKVNLSTEISMKDSVTASIYAKHLELLYCPLDKASTYSTLIIPHGGSPSPAIKPPDQPTASRVIINGGREGKARVFVASYHANCRGDLPCPAFSRGSAVQRDFEEKHREY